MPGEFVNQLQPGMKVGKYQIVSLVATGGMAMVYKAYDKSLDRYVAIKQIAPNLAADKKFLERFRREAQVLARLSQGQQNVVAVYELIEEGGGLFMVMEFVEGTSLQTLMDRGPASLNTGLGILLKITLGLKAIHAQGIVHRDLKPDNIMVQASGGVKIADFGLIGRTGGRTSLPMGTTQYMAPEMFAGGPVDSRADVYSLGFMAYQMFVGPEKFREIFRDIFADEQSASIRWMHWHSNPQLKAPSLREAQPGVPPLVARIVERMMEKDVGRRFASADQIIKWLRQIFVMYVQGKSVSEDESARMEKQVDEEIDGQTPAADGSIPQRRPSGAAAASSEAPKTAPLPKRRWGTYEYAKYGGIAAAAIVVILVILSFVNRAQQEKLGHRADDLLEEARGKYELKEFGEAASIYAKVIDNPEFRGLAAVRKAKFLQMAARAEEAREKKDYKQAEEYCKLARGLIGESDEFHGKHRGLADRIRNEGRYDQLQKQYFGAMERGDLRAAEEAVKTIIAEAVAPDSSLTESWLAAIETRRVQAAFRDAITAGDKARDRDQLVEAKALYTKAEETLRDHEELVEERQVVRGKMESLERYGQIKALTVEANKAFEEKKWARAADLYDQVIGLLDEDSRKNRTDLPRQRDEARSNAMTEHAEGLLAQGTDDSTQEAIKMLDEALTLWPANKEAARLKGGAINKDRYQRLLREAGEAERKRDYSTAIRLLEEAKQLEVDPERQKDIEARVTRNRVNDLMDRASAAEKEDRLDEALDLARQAQKIAPTDRNTLAYVRKLEQLGPYRQAVKRTHEAIEKEDFVTARKEAKDAQNMMNTQEARELVKEVEYRDYFSRGKKASDAGRYPEALGYFRIAQSYRPTDEIKNMIEECEKRLP
ncbi:MAG: protein kinase [Planctomycetes bacterium]|nr:protein kinase [Planctomycetota bacterium]